MSDFLTAMGSLFTFLFTQMGACASFFITNTLGQIIFGLVIFSMLISLFIYVITNVRK